LSSKPVGLKLSLVSKRALRTFLLLSLVVVTAGAVAVRRFRASEPVPAPALGSSRAQLLPPDRRAERKGGLDVTFIVASDTHFGFGASEGKLMGSVRDPILEPEGTERINLAAIRTMNALPGRPWPKELGGVIGKPRGVLVSGDLTESGAPWQWRAFVAYYGLNGADGLLDYPVFEAHGNHDKSHGWYVLDRVRERHGALHYAFDWDDLHVVCLGEAPDDDDLDWLERDLGEVGSDRPVVVYFHFPLRGPFSDNWFGRGEYRSHLAAVLRGHNVLGLFHGHYHASGRYRWQGHDVYNVGASKHRRHSFAVVHVDDARFRVASYQYVLERWEWWHEKTINGGTAAEHSGANAPDGGFLLAD
jgi:hypothetical protein